MRINSGLRFLVLDVDLDWRGGEVRKKVRKIFRKKKFEKKFEKKLETPKLEEVRKMLEKKS